MVVTVKTAVSGLAKECGVKISTSAELGGNLVFLVRHNSRPETALRCLAVALHATVVKSVDGLLVERTKDDVSQFLSKRSTERGKWISRRLASVEAYRSDCGAETLRTDKLYSEVLKEGASVEEMARGKMDLPVPHFAGELLPSEALLWDLVEAIGISKLASIPSGFTQVWEDEPALDALPLPNYEKNLSRYLSRYAAIDQKAIPSNVQQQFARLGMSEFFATWGQKHERPDRLRLMVRSEDGLISFFLSGYDSQGKQVVFSAERACSEAVIRFPSSIAREFLAVPSTRRVPIFAEALTAAKFRTITNLESLPIWFTHPESNEPMNEFVADGLRGLADQDRDSCFAVDVSDSLWSDVSASIVDGKVDLDALKATLQHWSLFEELRSGDSIVWRPCESLEGAGDQVNRKVLGDLARTVVKSGHLDLRTMANFTYRAGPRQTALINLWMWNLQASRAVPQESGHSPYGFYRLLGAISDSAWEDLNSGGTTMATTSDLGVRAELKQLIADEFEPVQADSIIPDVFRHAMELYRQQGLGDEPIHLVRSYRDWLGVSSQTNAGVVRWGSAKYPSGLGILPVHGYPEPKIAMSQEQFENWQRQRGAKICTGTQGNLTVIIGLPNNLYYREIFEGQITPTGSLVSYQDLPDATRDKLWKAACDAAMERASHRISVRDLPTSGGAKP